MYTDHSKLWNSAQIQDRLKPIVNENKACLSLGVVLVCQPVKSLLQFPFLTSTEVSVITDYHIWG